MAQHGPLSRAVLDALAVVAPTHCSGCGAPDRALCDACLLALVPAVHRSVRTSVHGSIAVWSALDYAGVAARVIGAYKDGGRTDAATPLAGPLRAAIGTAVMSAVPPRGAEFAAAAAAGVRLVGIPSSARAWRTRGFHPVELLLRRAGLRSFRALAAAVEAGDQVGLDRAGREDNKHGSLRASRRLSGMRCIVVDDIVTTGATLFEARRAIHAAGGEVLGFATLAETRLRSGAPGFSQDYPSQKL